MTLQIWQDQIHQKQSKTIIEEIKVLLNCHNISNELQDLSYKIDALLKNIKEESLESICILNDSSTYIKRKEIDEEITNAICDNDIVFVTGDGGNGKSIACRYNLSKLKKDYNIIEISYNKIDNIDNRIKKLVCDTIFHAAEINSGDNDFNIHARYIKDNGFSKYLDSINNKSLIVYIDNYSFNNGNGFVNNFGDITRFTNAYDVKAIVSCRQRVRNNYTSVSIDDISEDEFRIDLFKRFAEIDNCNFDNQIKSFLCEYKNLKNPFCIKFLAMCYIQNFANDSLTHFFSMAANVIDKNCENYIRIVDSLFNKFFIDSNVLNIDNIMLLHYISTCYGQIKYYELQLLIDNVKEFIGIKHIYENNAKYFDKQNVDKILRLLVGNDEIGEETEIYIHDIFADVIKEYVNYQKDEYFCKNLEDYYLFILSLTLWQLAFGRVRPYDYHAKYILPTAKLIAFVKERFQNNLSFKHPIIEAYNNLSYLRVSTQNNYEDILIAINDSKKAYTEINNILNSFKAGKHAEYFANCNCDNCESGCNNPGMKWACYYKQNIYANVYAKSLINSYNPFVENAKRILNDKSSIALKIIKRSEEKFNSKIKAINSSFNKALERKNEFLYTKALIYYKLASCNIKNDCNQKYAEDVIKKNMDNIYKLIFDYCKNNGCQDELISDFNMDNLINIINKFKQLYDNNRVKLLHSEIKNFMISVLLYSVIVLNKDSFTEYKQVKNILSYLNSIEYFFNDDSQRKNVVYAAETICYIKLNEFDNACRKNELIFGNITRRSYSIVALLLRKVIFDQENRDKNQKQQNDEKLSNLLIDFYEIQRNFINRLNSADYNNLLKYLIIS